MTRDQPDAINEAWLALQASASPHEVAAQCWRELMSNMAFVDISPPTQRLAPAIYANTQGMPDIPERDRLKGAYRYTWAKNTRLWSTFLPVLALLDHSGTDYRLLKGAAMHVRTGSPGTRVIGDFDLLIDSHSLPQVLAALTACGFRAAGERQLACGHRLGAEDVLNFNRDDCHVDLHVSPMKSPEILLQRMLQESADTHLYRDHPVRIPSAELMVLHAAWHASRRETPTDRSQGLADMAWLIGRSSPERVIELSDATRTLDALDAMVSGLPPQAAEALRGVDRSTTRRRPPSSKPQVKQPGGARRVGLILRTRSIRGLPAYRRESGLRLRGALYRFWLRIGLPVKLERVLSVGPGFLSRPLHAITTTTALRPFSHADSELVVASGWSPLSLDWRFRIEVPKGLHSTILRLEGDSVRQADGRIVINGRFAGRLVHGDTSLLEVHIPGGTHSIEVSIRPNWAACPSCFGDLTDLVAVVEPVRR